jgi:polyhydroxyalkanoate synthesis regulator phasin
VEEELGKRVEAVLGRMNLPTKSEIDELSKKIDRLSRKIDDFKKT